MAELCAGDSGLHSRSLRCEWTSAPDGAADPTVEDPTCDPTLFQGPSSPTMSFPTTQRSTGSCPNCKDHIQWFLSLSPEDSAPRTAGSLKGWSNSIGSLRAPIVGSSRSAPTISPKQVNIPPESALIVPSSPTRGVWSKKISTSPNTPIQ